MSDHYETRCPSCGGSDEQGCYADCPTTTIAALRAEVERLREWNREIALNAREFAAENEKLRAALRDARECVQAWSGYASEYFREKHDLAGDLARIDAALEEKP